MPDSPIAFYDVGNNVEALFADESEEVLVNKLGISEPNSASLRRNFLISRPSTGPIYRLGIRSEGPGRNSVTTLKADSLKVLPAGQDLLRNPEV